MKYLFLFTALLASLTACARLPGINPDGVSSSHEAASVCSRIFPKGRWQLYHTIEATAPGNHKNTLSGVAVISSEQRSIQWALMTVEGFVLFSGRFNGRLIIDRAIAPFDRPGFAQGLMADLMMLYFPPHEPLLATGCLETGDHVCRYSETGGTTDFLIKDDDTWAIRRYDSGRKLSRSVAADRMTVIDGNQFPERMILQRPGLLGYRLELTLVEAVPLDRQ